MGKYPAKATRAVTAIVGCMFAGIASAQVGGYVGLNIGATKVYQEATNGDEFDGFGANSAALFGGVTVGEHFALELGVRNYGTHTTESGTSNASVETSINAFTVSPVGRIPVADNVRLTGRVDLVNWELEQEATGYNDYDEDGSTVGFAFGFEADINDHFGLRAGLEVLSFETENDTELNLTNYNVGFQAMF